MKNNWPLNNNECLIPCKWPQRYQSVTNGDRQELRNGLLTMTKTGAREIMGRVEKLLSSLPSVPSSLYFSFYPCSLRALFSKLKSLQSRRDTRPLSLCMRKTDEIEVATIAIDETTILGLKRREKNTFKIVSNISFRDHSVNGMASRL